MQSKYMLKYFNNNKHKNYSSHVNCYNYYVLGITILLSSLILIAPFDVFKLPGAFKYFKKGLVSAELSFKY